MNWIKVYHSGSKGNFTIIMYNNDCYIIDAGVSGKVILDYLSDLKFNNLYVFISHSHIDHIRGLKALYKKTSCAIYGSKSIEKDFEVLVLKKGLHEIGNVKVDVIDLSHDSEHTIGFIFYVDDKKIVYISDTGYISEENLELVNNPDILLLEANHDVSMLMEGKYPWNLKNRVVGDYGHLSNIQFTNYAKYIIGSNTKELVALHLSEENNMIESVMQCFKHFDNINCQIALQHKGCDFIKI